MMTEEERQEHASLRERVRLQQEKIEVQQALLEQQEKLLSQQHTLFEGLHKQVGLLEERLNKDSHNSHLPPSSDGFHRQPKSLRSKSGKQAGGQPGHPGSTLILSSAPDKASRSLT